MLMPTRVSRQSSSGTYEFFREHALGNSDFRFGSRDLNGSKQVVELVGSTLPDQLQEETEEQRRLRLLMEQMQAAVSPFGAS